MPRNKLTDPRDRDCLVAECPNVEYRRGVCRNHWEALPRAWKLEWQVELMTLTYSLGQKHAQQVELFYADRLKPEAERLGPAMRQ